MWELVLFAMRRGPMAWLMKRSPTYAQWRAELVQGLRRTCPGVFHASDCRTRRVEIYCWPPALRLPARIMGHR
jgi:hypothetical protein